MRPTTDSFVKRPLDVSQKSTCTPPLPNAQAERGPVAAQPLPETLFSKAEQTHYTRTRSPHSQIFLACLMGQTRPLGV